MVQLRRENCVNARIFGWFPRKSAILYDQDLYGGDDRRVRDIAGGTRMARFLWFRRVKP
jgi:hypothetical protein